MHCIWKDGFYCDVVDAVNTDSEDDAFVCSFGFFCFLQQYTKIYFLQW